MTVVGLGLVCGGHLLLASISSSAASRSTNEASTRRIMRRHRSHVGSQGQSERRHPQDAVLRAAPPGHAASRSAQRRRYDAAPRCRRTAIRALRARSPAPLRHCDAQLPGGVVHADLMIDCRRRCAHPRPAWSSSLVSRDTGRRERSPTVRRCGGYGGGLPPLREIVRQTRLISPRPPRAAAHLAEPVEELSRGSTSSTACWPACEGAYQQLEGFNADVAHELRTPLANLIGETEVALSRERSLRLCPRR